MLPDAHIENGIPVVLGTEEKQKKTGFLKKVFSKKKKESVVAWLELT